VTQQAVERTLGKLLTDENFREALTRLGEGLDKRISRASLGPNQGEEGKAELT